MNRLTENVLVVAIGFVVTFILTSILSIITLENGTISFGEPIAIKQEWYIPVQIRNYRAMPLPDIQLTAPKTTLISGIISSVPIRIEEISSTVGANETRKLLLTGIEEKTAADLLLPISAPDKAKFITFLNLRSADIVLNPPDDLESPKIGLLKRSLEVSIVYSLIFSIYLAFVYRSNRRINKRIDEANRKLEEQDSECRRCKAESSAEAKSAAKIVKRLQILLLARINDYQKELSFWRDAVRKVIYTLGDDKKAAQDFLIGVTKSLKTYGTLGTSDEYGFTAVQTMADIIATSEAASQFSQPCDQKESSQQTSGKSN